MKPVPRGLAAAREAFARLHACPEQAGDEVVSSAVVADLCRDIGATVTTGVGGHGVIARIGTGKPVVAFRAELDALATSEGAKHLCGHDLHSAALIGALAALQAGEASRTGTVLAFFQPAEETGTGAAAMVAAGIERLVPKPSVLLAQHSSPLPHDVVAFRPGPITSSNETVSIELTASGGHPGLIGTHRHALTVTFSRLVDAVNPRIGQVTQARLGGSAKNALPNSAAVTVDLRAPDDASLSSRRQALKDVLKQVLFDGVEHSTTAARTFAGASNDFDAAELLYKAFAQHGRTTVLMPGPSGTSDDVGVLAHALGAPLVYWFWGVSGSSGMPLSDRAALTAGRAPVSVPANHSPLFSVRSVAREWTTEPADRAVGMGLATNHPERTAHRKAAGSALLAGRNHRRALNMTGSMSEVPDLNFDELEIFSCGPVVRAHRFKIHVDSRVVAPLSLVGTEKGVDRPKKEEKNHDGLDCNAVGTGAGNGDHLRSRLLDRPTPVGC